MIIDSNCGANHNNGILQAFTKIFEGCNPQSSLKLACLSAIEEMLIPVRLNLYFSRSSSAMMISLFLPFLSQTLCLFFLHLSRCLVYFLFFLSYRYFFYLNNREMTWCTQMQVIHYLNIKLLG